MTSADWNDLKAAFAELVDLPAAERAERLERIARTRPDVAARVATLLAADAAADERLHAYEAGPMPGEEPALADPLGLVGGTIGHFKVEEVLGRGGMGVAYRARDTRLDRAVALKFLLPHHALDVDAKTLLLNEARTASALDHPNVCTVFEIGETEAGLFFAMPAYSGETLQDRLARDGALPVPSALDLTRQLLRALAAAHAAGITHRDLKPGNLIITADGTLKVLDFGIATMRDVQRSSSGSTPGTMAYMSPEQLVGGDVDHRTDLWSAGVVLHEMLTGTLPFGGGQDLATPYSILNDDPPPAGCAPQVDAFVTRLLAIQPAERFASADAALGALEQIMDPARGTASVRRRIVVYAMVAVLVLIAGWMFLDGADRPAGGAAAPSVAVLPFTDASSDGSQGYLGEGIAEDILNTLAQVPGLRVPGRRSSFAFKDRDVPAQEVARQLGVAALVDGSVEQADGRVRIQVRLVDPHLNRPLWSDRFDRPLRDIALVRSEIASMIADALTVRLVPSGAEPPSNFAAYELYLRGLFHWHRRSPQDIRLAIDFFQQATHHDSTFARPWAGLALAYAVLPPLDGSSNELLERAEQAAARALALDSTLADAWAARGYARHWQWRWIEAERSFQRAIALSPTHSTAHQWYGEHLAKMGRAAEGERMVRRAIELDPLALVAQNDLGIVLMLDRRFDEAIAQLQRVSQADPAFGPALLLQHRIHLLLGDTAAARETGRRAAELIRIFDPAEVALLSRATQDPALREQAIAILKGWERQSSPRWPDIAMYYTLLGENRLAIDALEQGMRARSPHLAQLRAAPWMDPLRNEPRVQEIMRRLAFP